MNPTISGFIGPGFLNQVSYIPSCLGCGTSDSQSGLVSLMPLNSSKGLEGLGNLSNLGYILDSG